MLTLAYVKPEAVCAWAGCLMRAALCGSVASKPSYQLLSLLPLLLSLLSASAYSATCLQVLTGHSEDVTCVVMTSKARFAVTGSLDGTAQVWDMHAQDVSNNDVHDGKVRGRLRACVRADQGLDLHLVPLHIVCSGRRL